MLEFRKFHDKRMMKKVFLKIKMRDSSSKWLDKLKYIMPAALHMDSKGNISGSRINPFYVEEVTY
jgi:hypothetical protein